MLVIKNGHKVFNSRIFKLDYDLDIHLCQYSFNRLKYWQKFGPRPEGGSSPRLAPHMGASYGPVGLKSLFDYCKFKIEYWGGRVDYK